ncbi:MAG TPA: DUF3052 domain-containing protein [Gemmatimonadales bacterium]|nr:DUF3052 domain-containing protein [Gemmatimonadales bacterium]
MRTTGYSGKRLVDKLGIKPGFRIAIIAARRGYRSTLGPLPIGVSVASSLRGVLPFIHFFTTRRAQLERRFPSLKRALAQDGALWVSWPKKASGVATDLTEDVVREVALAGGLVDVKVCAIDEVWSGLKLVRRLKDRSP